MRGANWIHEKSSQERKQALKVTKKIKCNRKGAKFRLVKICDKPPTWKEVLITE